MSFTDVDPHAPEFTARNPVRPGGVMLRDRLGSKQPQEVQLGEEQLSEDSFSLQGRIVGAGDLVQTVDQTNGMVVYLNRADTQYLGETVKKVPYLDSQVTTDTARKSATEPDSDVQALTELYWKRDNEANVGEATSLSDVASQQRRKVASDTQASSAAATGVTGYGKFGYGQGGYGGTIQLTG